MQTLIEITNPMTHNAPVTSPTNHPQGLTDHVLHMQLRSLYTSQLLDLTPNLHLILACKPLQRFRTVLHVTYKPKNVHLHDNLLTDLGPHHQVF